MKKRKFIELSYKPEPLDGCGLTVVCNAEGYCYRGNYLVDVTSADMEYEDVYFGVVLKVYKNDKGYGVVSISQAGDFQGTLTKDDLKKLRFRFHST